MRSLRNSISALNAVVEGKSSLDVERTHVGITVRPIFDSVTSSDVRASIIRYEEVHLAVPTPIIIDDDPVKCNLVGLRLLGGPKAKIVKVRVSDGEDVVKVEKHLDWGNDSVDLYTLALDESGSSPMMFRAGVIITAYIKFEDARDRTNSWMTLTNGWAEFSSFKLE